MTNKGIPYIDNSGNIIVPFNADPKYHYWNGGQHLSKSMQEIKAPAEVSRKHMEKPCHGNSA